MIVPTQRAVLLALAAAPAALGIGVVAPGGWALAILLVMAVTALVIVDARLADRVDGPITIEAPSLIPVGGRAVLVPRIAGSPHTAFAADMSLPLEPDGVLAYRAPRRGLARLSRVWARASGPMGLGVRQRSSPADIEIRVIPDIRAVRETAMRDRLSAARAGARLRSDGGDGQEFEALTAFQPGMSRRAIDWKASARHRSLQAREYRAERETSLVLAVDAGRTMAEPVGGVPRVDRAVSAALLAAFVALRSGDRTRLFAFDSRPRVDSGSLSGAHAFTRLNAEAAGIDYGDDEANFTLALTQLDQRLDRRSLIVLFTELTDPTGAELLLAAGTRLLRRHRLLFVLFDDVELQAIENARPVTADDVTRANVAAVLLRERRIVIERLRRQGIDVIEAAPDAAPLALVERYLSMRERI